LGLKNPRAAEPKKLNSLRKPINEKDWVGGELEMEAVQTTADHSMVRFL
jgi:hypothetical protein